MSTRICVISARMEMNVRRSVSGLRMPSSCFSCSGVWSIRACCVGHDGCSSFLVIHRGLGVQRMISVLSAYFHTVWSRPSSLFACRGSGCLSASSYSARSCSSVRTGITSMEIWRPWIAELAEMAAFCAAVYFGCRSGLNVVLLDFIDCIDLLMFVVRVGHTDWFQMLFKPNSIFFGNTAVRGSHFVALANPKP